VIGTCDRTWGSHFSAAIIRYYGGPPNNWPPEKVRANILNTYNKTDLSNFSDLDFVSIMMSVVLFFSDAT
jgi:hypothetical protein